MTKEHKAHIVTILVLAAAVGVAILRTTDVGTSFGAVVVQRTTESTPEDAVYSMLDAARAGDVAKYLASHTGQMEQSLRRARSESTDFAQYLRNSNAGIRGIAVTEPEVLSAQEVKLRVEYVFQDRNEIQFVYLEKTDAGWKISQVDSAERIKTPVPYGATIQ
jgi:hypothetical protein